MDYEILERLFEEFYGSAPETVTEITGSASNRGYFRLYGGGLSAVGVLGQDRRENEAFLSLDNHFESEGLPVPHVLAVSSDHMAYLQEDLGNTLLSDLIANAKTEGDFNNIMPLLLKTIRELARFQADGGRDLDYNQCYPMKTFDGTAIMFDLNYFKYCFLKPSGLEFDEIALQEDFMKFSADLLDCTGYGNTFLYRDFQSRNVMIRDGKPYFIDFQDGRRGPVYYDLVSFVWQVRAAYPEYVKDALVDEYICSLESYVGKIDKEKFNRELRLFRLLRLLQVLGAYGFRGVIEHKSNFITSLIPAVGELKRLIKAIPFYEYPYLQHLLEDICSMPKFSGNDVADDALEVKVYSFSYKKGIPDDWSGNGGGYVFDCRSIHNPGRYEEYKKLTGRDKPVVDFLEEDGEVIRYLSHVYGVVDPHVETYVRRGFRNLSVSFGCTGGQHRSVYCAEKLALHLHDAFPQIRVHLIHRERGIDIVL